MHEHDLDLIAALAEGSLDDESVARALVEECQECREEMLAQEKALTALASVPPTGMTDWERARLHRDVWTGIRGDEPATRGPIRWYRWAYVAAGLFVVVGLAGVLNRGFGMGGDAAGVEETFSEIGSALDGESEPAAHLYGDVNGDEEADTAGGSEEGVTTTIAAADGATPSFADLAVEARAMSMAGKRAYEPSSIPSEVMQCLTGLGLDDMEIVEDLDLDVRYLVLMSGERDDLTVTFVSVDDCRVAAVDAADG